MSEPVAVGIDIGGTKLAGSAVTADGRMLNRRVRESPKVDADAIIEAVGDLAQELGSDGLPVGVGIAGIVSPDGVMRYGPNLPVGEVPIGPRLAERLSAPVVVRNDADVALYGEYRAGAGRGHDDLVMLTLGTGVGGALLVGGRIVGGTSGFAGELGHMVIVDGGRHCACGNLGCLEAYASGSAMGERARDLLTRRATDSRLRDLPDGELQGRHVTDAAVEGDAFAQEVLADAGAWLGVGIANLVNALDPSLVLVGGGASVRPAPWLLPAASRSMRDRVMGAAYRTLPDVVLAGLGEHAGLIGAALLAAASGGRG